MAEVKKEIIEHIFSSDKDNGQSIQLNIIKWGKNSSKYDLRVWDGDKTLKGFTMSDQELKQLAGAFVKAYGKSKQPAIKEKIVEVPAERLSFDVARMNSIDLTKVFEKFPNSKNDYTLLSSVLRDLYPLNTLEVNLVLNLFHSGVASQIMRLKNITQVDMNRYVNIMEMKYGIMEQYTTGAVMLWANALGIPCNIKINAERGEQEKKAKLKPVVTPLPVPSYGHKYNEVVFENEDIAVTYKGVYKFDGLFAQGHRIRFVIENKTNQKMRIEGKSISANGYVVASSDLFNSEVEPHKKVIDTVLMRQSNLSSAGIKKVSDMKELSITFEYEMNRTKKRTSEIYLEPYEVKE